MQLELTPQLILRAYSLGLFPMGDANGQIGWYSPDPRCIIELDFFHIPKRLFRTYHQHVFDLQIDHNWHSVIKNCATRDSTWITDEIIDVYTKLHEVGLAHSVEAYKNGKLAGGLYGVSIKGAFMAESMYHHVTDASKVCLVYLVEYLKKHGFTLLDVQYMTRHLNQFGAKNIPQREYLDRLEKALQKSCSFV